MLILRPKQRNLPEKAWTSPYKNSFLDGVGVVFVCFTVLFYYCMVMGGWHLGVHMLNMQGHEHAIASWVCV